MATANFRLNSWQEYLAECVKGARRPHEDGNFHQHLEDIENPQHVLEGSFLAAVDKGEKLGAFDTFDISDKPVLQRSFGLVRDNRDSGLLKFGGPNTLQHGRCYMIRAFPSQKDATTVIQGSVVSEDVARQPRRCFYVCHRPPAKTFKTPKIKALDSQLQMLGAQVA